MIKDIYNYRDIFFSAKPCKSELCCNGDYCRTVCKQNQNFTSVYSPLDKFILFHFLFYSTLLSKQTKTSLC